MTRAHLLGGLLFDGRPFTSDDWTAAGRTLNDLWSLRATGEVRRELTGVFVDSRAPSAIETRAPALGIVLPPGAAVCRTTAAWFYGVDARSPSESHLPVPLQCVTPKGRSPVNRPGVQGFASDQLLDRDLTEVHGIRVTTPQRTVMDLLRWVNPGVALGAADWFARLGLIDPAEVLLELGRWRGRHGVAVARRLAGFIDPRPESPLESAGRLRFLDAEIPVDDLQIVVRRGGRERRIDMGWPEARVGVEANGEEYHTEPEHVAADAERRAWLEDVGWRLKEATKGQIWGWDQDLEYSVAAMLGLTVTIRKRTW